MPDDLAFRPVTARNLADFEALFSATGAPKFCWCMVWRRSAAEANHARQEGATIVEAYPVAPDAPSYRFMGFVPVFAEAGFTEVGRAGHRRHVMRLGLT